MMIGANRKTRPLASSAWSRRQFFTFSALATVASTFGFDAVARAAAAKAAKATYQDNIYTRMFGVRPVVGAFETLSRYGNSKMSAEVLQAMAEAQEFFVDMDELNRAAGKHIATIMKTESAMVTSCSFGAMMLGAAACLTGTDRDRVVALPHPTWPKRECLMQKAHRFTYDRAYRAAGMTIVEVETRDEFASAITDKTAMIAVLGMVEREPKPAVMTPKELIDIARKAGVPVLVDSAGELPPADRLTRYSEMGADLVVISGGKGLHGPSSTGILAGRRDLIDAAIVNASPNANIGRGQKVNREEIVGLVVALEHYLKVDHEAELAAWTKKAKYMADQLQRIPGLTADFRMNSRGYADVVLSWDKSIIPLTEAEVGQKLLAGEPRIAYMTNKIIYAFTNPTLVPSSLKDGEEVIMAKRLRQFFLEQAGRPTAASDAESARDEVDEHTIQNGGTA
jgi:D-glucosaminate-6-phosphate ammonia-lyase